jgi:hypothetical protein
MINLWQIIEGTKILHGDAIQYLNITLKFTLWKSFKAFKTEFMK